MYKPLQKKNSSWTPTTAQKKSKSASKLGHFSIQPKPQQKSSQSPEIGEYSRDSADRLAANVMRSLEAKGSQETETPTVQPKSESRISVADVVGQRMSTLTPRTLTPQLRRASEVVPENPIQRQCADCASEPQEQSAEAEKEVEQISLAANGMQAKLTVGAPGDKYEVEADTVARQVMLMPAPVNNQPIQREGIAEEKVEKVQAKPIAASITPLVQREMALEDEKQEKVQAKATSDGGFETSSNVETQLNASKGGGSPLSNEVRSFMEPRFGADFSSVRVHTGGEAVQMSRELGAQAFTHERDIFFGAGKSPGNNEWTANELTHVVQQGREQIALNIKEIAQSKQFTNEKEINPQVELSNNKGGGTEKECADILRRIRNLIQEVRKRIGELAENLHNLPETHPDDDKKPRLSKRGHRRLINEAKESLAAQKAKYVAKCGQLPEDVRESDDPNVNWFRLPDWAVRAGVIIVAGAIVIGAAVTLPSWGLAALITLASLLGLQLIDRRPIH